MTPEATTAAQALQQELAKPEPLPPLRLREIIPDFLALIQAREEAVEDGAPPDELKAIDAEINRYAVAQGKKIDGIASLYHAEDDAEIACDREIARITAARDRHRARKERIKAASLYAMQTNGVTKIETPLNRLRIQRNGGLAPLEVNEDTLPREYKVVRVAMRASDWDSIYPRHNAPPVLAAIAEPDNARIREALGCRIPCPECAGERVYLGPVVDGPICPRCHGQGTVQQIIPGTRLGERGQHLRVE